MAVYMCDMCGEYKDGDYSSCIESTGGGDFCCEECAAELEGEEAEMKKEFKRMKDEYDREIISGLTRKL